MAVKLWSSSLAVEALKATEVAPLIGDDDNSIIQMKTETKKGSGDTVTFGLRMQLNGDGFTENELAEGNGEALTLYSDSVALNELGHVAGVKSKNTIDAQRVPFDIREQARNGLADWYAKRFSVSFFRHACGYNVSGGSTKYSGLNAVAAPSASRIVRAAGAANDQSLTSADTFTLDLIDKAKELAVTADPQIRPVLVGSDKFYVVYLHPTQVTSLRTNTSTGQWLDITKAAMAGMDSSKSPIFTGALGIYNKCVLREAHDVTPGLNSGSLVDVANTRRAVLLGAQAVTMAFGQDNGPRKFRWNEELYDHKRRLEVSVWSIFGMKKTRFNSTDFGTVVIPTYAAPAA